MTTDRAHRPALRTWAALLPAMTVPGLAALFYFVLLEGGAAARGIYAAGKLFTLLWPVLAARFLLHDLRRREPVGWRLRLRAVPGGLFSGALLVAALFLLLETPAGEMARESAGAMRAKAVALGILDHYVAFALFLSLGNSLVEEYYWRWFVFGRLRAVLPPVAAHLLAAAAFALHHVLVATQFFPLSWGLLLGGLTGAGGLLWSVMYRRQGTLAGAWVSHLVVDLGLMAAGRGLIFGAA